MSERLKLTQIGEQHSEVLTVHKSQLFSMGVEDKFFLECEYNGQTINLIKRPNGEKYIRIWSAMRDAGLPVATRVFRDGKGYVYVADMKSEGELYDRGLTYTFMPNPLPRFRPRYEIDGVFLDLMREESDYEQIKKVAYEIADIASDSGIRLPADDTMSLLVFPDRSFELLILDLVGGEVYDDNISARKGQALADANLRSVEKFIDDLHLLVEYMEKPGDTDYQNSWGFWSGL